jgi:hypothetical protein
MEASASGTLVRCERLRRAERGDDRAWLAGLAVAWQAGRPHLWLQEGSWLRSEAWGGLARSLSGVASVPAERPSERWPRGAARRPRSTSVTSAPCTTEDFVSITYHLAYNLRGDGPEPGRALLTEAWRRESVVGVALLVTWRARPLKPAR